MTPFPYGVSSPVDEWGDEVMGFFGSAPFGSIAQNDTSFFGFIYIERYIAILILNLIMSKFSHFSSKSKQTKTKQNKAKRSPAKQNNIRIKIDLKLPQP